MTMWGLFFTFKLKAMHNINFLKEIITTEHEYWVVAKKNDAQEYGRTVRQRDSIILIAIPFDIKRGVPAEEVLLKDIEKLRNSYCDTNIHINESFAPFQRCMSFYDIYRGFPIEVKVKEFMIKAIELNSDEIYDYQALAMKPKEEITPKID